MVLGTIPFKGQVLNRMAAYWFEETADLAPNHVINVPDPNVMVARECEPLPVEFVMRAYLTGVTSTSIWSAVRSAARARSAATPCPTACSKNQRLPKPILTPSTKAEKGDHDESVSRAEVLAMGLLSARATSTRRPLMCARLFAFGQARGARGAGSSSSTPSTRSGAAPTASSASSTRSTRRTRRATGTPTTTRRGSRAARSRAASTRSTCGARWPTRATAATGRRRTLPDDVRVEAARRYIEVCELVTGRPFVPDTDGADRAHPPQSRRSDGGGATAMRLGLHGLPGRDAAVAPWPSLVAALGDRAEVVAHGCAL